MSLTQLIAREVDSLLYDKLHELLGRIASDYDLDHGQMVQKYLIDTRDSPPPQFVYVSSEKGSDSEVEKPKKKRTTPKAAKVSDDESTTKPAKKKCEGTTKAGSACKNPPFAGGCFCRVHTPKEGGEKKEKKEKKETKKEKRIKKTKEPVHSHEIDSECDEDCPLNSQPAPGAKIPPMKIEIENNKLALIAKYFTNLLGTDVEPEDVSDQMIEEYECDKGGDQGDEDGSEYHPSEEDSD